MISNAECDPLIKEITHTVIKYYHLKCNFNAFKHLLTLSVIQQLSTLHHTENEDSIAFQAGQHSQRRDTSR